MYHLNRIMDLEVIPDNWILPNRIAYNKFVYNTFHPSKYPILQTNKSGCECSAQTGTCEVPSDTVSLFPQQRIVRDFIQVNSPYRGILLYHELGSGKSAASIAAAEGYVGRRKVFVITPASLAQNYENELMKISTVGLNMKKSWTLLKIDKNDFNKKILLDNYAISIDFIKKDGMVWIPLYQDDIPNAIVVTNGVKYSSMSGSEKDRINETIVHIIRNRYTFISYNGLTQKLVESLKKTGFNNTFVVIDEVHNFISRIVNGSKLAKGIYNALMQAKDCKLVLLSGTPIINNPFEISTLINLIRGPMTVYELRLLKNSAQPDDKQLIDILNKADMYQFVDEIHFDKNKNSISLTLMTEGYAKAEQDTKIIMKDWKMTSNKTVEKIIETLNATKSLKIGVKSGSEFFFALPNKKDEFNQFFIDTSNEDNPKPKNMDLFQRRVLGTLSYYKISGTELFPTVLPNNIQYIEMTDHQFGIYADVRKKEREMDNAQKRHAGDVMSDKSSVYRAFSRMVCNFVFPEEIKRQFPQDVKKLLRAQLDIGDEDDDDNDDDIAKEKDDKKLSKKVKDEYEKSLDKALKELVAGDDYLSRHNLQTMYSPKYAKMLEDIEESPGTVLIYSQFRTMEGLGIFSKVLDADGYKEIVIKKTENGYEFEDMSVFDAQYDDKRYVIFNSDRIITNMLINLFNGSFTVLPESLRAQLPKNYLAGTETQLYGKLAKIMMITQSGAEGISLKNVRRVLIMEYFWNAVRINQVIGRAVRTCSHELLPTDERNVQVFTYIMKFKESQLKKDFTIRTLDKLLTTDQHILQLATKKDYIIQQFLNMLKAASFDCIINSVQNKPMENGYKCYNWAINANGHDLAYTENIDDEYKIQKHQRYQVLQKNKGVVVSRDGTKYVMINNKLYDYFSYKHAGILLPI